VERVNLWAIDINLPNVLRKKASNWKLLKSPAVRGVPSSTRARISSEPYRERISDLTDNLGFLGIYEEDTNVFIKVEKSSRIGVLYAGKRLGALSYGTKGAPIF